MRDYKTNPTAQLQSADGAIAQFRKEREAMWHTLAVQHLQRVRIIELLSELNSKLAILIDAALRKERPR